MCLRIRLRTFHRRGGHVFIVDIRLVGHVLSVSDSVMYLERAVYLG